MVRTRKRAYCSDPVFGRNGPTTRGRNGKRGKRSPGVKKAGPKFVQKPKIQGKKQDRKQGKGGLKQNDPGNTNPDEENVAANKKTVEDYGIDTLPGPSQNNMTNVFDDPLIVPTNKMTINLLRADGRPFDIHDMVFVKPDIMVVNSVIGLVRAMTINMEGRIRIFGELSVACIAQASKKNDNTILYFDGSRHADVVALRPKLKITKTIDLKKKYKLLRVLDQESLIGVRNVDDYKSRIDVLDMKGALLKTIKPSFLKGLSLLKPEYLYVGPQKQIIVIDNMTKLVACFPSSGPGGFAYGGSNDNNDYYWAKSQGIKQVFQKECYTLRKACCAAFDSKANMYVADMYSGMVTKVDPKGNFVQNILPLNDTEICERAFQIYIDENDHLFVSYDSAEFLLVYEL